MTLAGRKSHGPVPSTFLESSSYRPPPFVTVHSYAPAPAAWVESRGGILQIAYAVLPFHRPETGCPVAGTPLTRYQALCPSLCLGEIFLSAINVIS